MFTCTKKYIDLPFAHRQYHHDGHCALVHGHNWAFEFTFGAIERDTCGFVIDFGKLKFIKTYLEKNFDHTLALAKDDPELHFFMERLDLFNIVVVDDPSAEGLAKTIFNHVDKLVREQTQDRAHLIKVTVYEDSKDSASYSIGG